MNTSLALPARRTLNLVSAAALSLTLLTGCSTDSTSSHDATAHSTATAPSTASSSASAHSSAHSSSAPAAPSSSSSSASATGAVDEAAPHHHAPIHGVKLVFPASERGAKAHVTGTLVNEGTETITITGAKTESAESAELHETRSGTMSVSAQWVLKPGQKLELTEDGFHINLVNLKASLAEGETLELTLTTSDGPAHVEVGAGEAAAGGHHH